MRFWIVSFLFIFNLFVPVTSNAAGDPAARPNDVNSFINNLKKSVALVDCGFQGIGFFGSYKLPDTYVQNGYNSLLVTNLSLAQDCSSRKRELIITVGNEHPKNQSQSAHGTGVDFVSFRTSYKPEKTLDLYDTFQPEIGWWVMVVTYDSYQGIVFNESKITSVSDNGILNIDPISPAPKFKSGLVVSSQGNFLGLVTSAPYGGDAATGKWKVHGAKLQCSKDPGEATITSCSNISVIWSTKYLNTSSTSTPNSPTPTPSTSSNSDNSSQKNEKESQEIILGDNPTTISIARKQLELDVVSSSGLDLQFRSLTNSICKVALGIVTLIKTGSCSVEISQEGNDEFLPANSIILDFNISSASRTITCVKGKITKKVIGANPKCPAGYRIK